MVSSIKYPAVNYANNGVRKGNDHTPDTDHSASGTPKNGICSQVSTNKRMIYAPLASLTPSPIRTLTVGSGFPPDPPAQNTRLYDAPAITKMITGDTGRGLWRTSPFTAGRDFHPAPKVAATSQGCFMNFMYYSALAKKCTSFSAAWS